MPTKLPENVPEDLPDILPDDLPDDLSTILADDGPDTVEQKRAAINAAAGPLAHSMGIEFVEVDPQRLVATMPVEGNTQPYGLLHGGASCVLAETLGSVGAALHAGADRVAVGVDINATHHHAVRDGTVTGVAVPAHVGRTLVTYQVAINDDAGVLVSSARITCILRDV